MPFFEAVSGLTTTGATVIVGLDDAPPGMLLWRALLQWMGGIGIIATAIAILPDARRRRDAAVPHRILRPVGEGDAAGAPDRRPPSARSMSLSRRLRAGLLARGHDAVRCAAHALTTVSTAGFSTSDASLGHWDGAGDPLDRDRLHAGRRDALRALCRPAAGRARRSGATARCGRFSWACSSSW